MLSFLFNRGAELRTDLRSAWRLSRAERQIGLAILAVGTLAFFLFVSQALLHNHSARLPYMLQNDQLQAGRWFNLIIGRLNYGADIPVLLPLQSIVMATLTALISLRIWSLGSGFWSNFLSGSWIVTFPFALALFYFSYQTPLFYSGWVFSALAVWVLRRPTVLHLVIASMLIMLVCASYQAMLSVFAVLVATAALADLLRDQKQGRDPLIRVVARIVAAICALAAGLGLYWLSLKYLNVTPPGETSVTGLLELPERIWDVGGAVVSHLRATQPELQTFQNSILLFILFAAVISTIVALLSRGDWLRAVLAAVFWLGAILSTKAIFIIVSPAGYIFDYRYNTSFAFLYTFSIYVLMSPLFKGVVLRKGAIIIATVLLVMFVQADLVRQLVLLRGQQHDLALSNRILTRIEGLPELEAGRVYDLVRIGRYPPYRDRILRRSGRSWDKPGDSHMDFGEVSARWIDEEVMRLLGASIQFRHAFTDLQSGAKEAEARAEHLEDRHPWPHETSVFIVEDTIYVYVQ